MKLPCFTILKQKYNLKGLSKLIILLLWSKFSESKVLNWSLKYYFKMCPLVGLQKKSQTLSPKLIINFSFLISKMVENWHAWLPICWVLVPLDNDKWTFINFTHFTGLSVHKYNPKQILTYLICFCADIMAECNCINTKQKIKLLKPVPGWFPSFDLDSC